MTRRRRDPRAERERLKGVGGARPRFDLAATRAGRLRRDPMREKEAATVGGDPRLRLDRWRTTPIGNASKADLRPAAPADAVAIQTIENPAFWVLAVADPGAGGLTVHDRQALGAARRLAGAEGGVALLADRWPPDAGAAGADRVLVAATVDHPAARAAAAQAAAALLQARHVLAPESADGGDVVRRLAAASGADAFTGVEQVAASAVARTVRARGVEQRRAPPRFMTIARDSVATHTGEAREARRLDLPLFAEPRVTPALRLKTDAGALPLGEAGFVLSAGNGVSDFEAFRALAQALGATPGASRVTCDAGLMPREAQVGASGAVLTADVYVALGIAGAPQHLQGIGACPHVIAVNTDLHAAMAARAELSVIADAQAVMAALLRLLSEGAGR